VHQAGTEALKQLALSEHDLGLVAHAARHVAGALDRLAELEQIDEQLRAPGEQGGADGDRRRERNGSDRDAYERTFRSSAVIAGMISVRSPITA
jgi:hypothetical protein